MAKKRFKHDGLNFFYLDAEGDGSILVALHAHWFNSLGFENLGRNLLPGWRVIAMDQRGHGETGRASSYSRNDYLGDIEALLDHLQLDRPVVLLGNSLGGVNAYQFAARHPNRVRALIIEDIGVEIADNVDFIRNWQGVFATRQELIDKIGPRLGNYLESSFRETQRGWRLAFEPLDMIESQKNLNGNYWDEWLQSKCPALVIRGRDSRITTEEHLREMVKRRPNTDFCIVSGGHTAHIDNPVEFEKNVRAFLSKLKPE